MLEGFAARARTLERRAFRGRRGALRQRVGPRFPPRVPADRGFARALRRDPVHRADRDGDPTRARRHHPPLAPARAAHVRRELQPAEPDVPRRPKERATEALIDFLASAPERQRDRVRAEPRLRRRPRRASASRRHLRPAPTMPGSTRRSARAIKSSSARRRPRDLRDDRLWDGHRQVQRALRRALRPAQEHRGLLSGDRPRRARRPPGRLPALLQLRRHREARIVPL